MEIRIGRFFQRGEIRGRPFRDGEREVTPVARSLSLTLSRRGFPIAGRFVWTRPIAVEVAEGRTVRRIPIPDYRMRIAFGMAVAMILAVLVESGRKAAKAKQQPWEVSDGRSTNKPGTTK